MQNESKRARTRKVYQVIEKVFWLWDGQDVQMADAFSTLTQTCSSLKKAQQVLQVRLESHLTNGYMTFVKRPEIIMQNVHEIWECKKDYGKRVYVYIQSFEVI